MNIWLALSKKIDALNEWVGRWVAWLVLFAVLISAGNAVIRKLNSQLSSNAWLEAQWYLFSAVFLLTAGYTLLKQEHVRIDVLSNRLSKRAQIKIEAVCFVIFLAPFVVYLIWMVWPLVLHAFETGEKSSNSGGLIRWPVFALIPIGFTLLGLQGVSEFIKRIAFLKGLIDDPTQKKEDKTAEEELAEIIRLRQYQSSQK
jgi:TRAP-type mannitol/chloroaromatic compound transport system permease small subunit